MAITFQLCFRGRHEEGSGKPGMTEIKWSHQLLVCADDDNILGESVYSTENLSWLVV